MHDIINSIDKAKGFNFIGIFTEALTYPEFFHYVDKWISDKSARSHHVAIINAYCATVAFQNNRVRKIYSKADLVAPDGRPFVYWLRWMLKRQCAQFDASSIVMNLAEKSRETGYSFYLYGGHPDVIVNMKSKLENMYPHINIVGYYSPPFRSLSEDEEKSIRNEINTLKPDIVCVGLGTPKQDYWIDEHIYKIKGAVFIPCGAIFDFFGGRIKRAPVFIQKSGFEWLYRLFSKDFKRLFKRYTYMNLVFLWNFFLQLTHLKVQKPFKMFRK